MKEFGKTEYKKTIYVNFENNDLVREHFTKDLNTKRIIEGLELEYSKIDPENTLIKIFTEFNGALAEQYVLQQMKTLDDIEISY